MAVGDASLYLSAEDDAAIASQEGKTITAVDFKGVPGEVKPKLYPLLQSKPGGVVSAESVRNDVASLGSTGVFSQISPSFRRFRRAYSLITNWYLIRLSIMWNLRGIPFLLMNI